MSWPRNLLPKFQLNTTAIIRLDSILHSRLDLDVNQGYSELSLGGGDGNLSGQAMSLLRVQIARGVCGCTPPKIFGKGGGYPKVTYPTHETPKKRVDKQGREGDIKVNVVKMQQ